MSDYRVGEIFRRDGVTYQCVVDSEENGYCGKCQICDAFILCEKDYRADNTSVHFIRVTELEEGMLFRASNGVLYELKLLGSTPGKCGCHINTPNNLPCRVIDRQAFGKTQINSLHWYPVEEKGDEKMAEKKRHIELAVTEVDGEMVTFHVAEQTHRGEDFTPGGIPFKSSRGLTLKSVGAPAALTTSDTVYVRGGTEGCDKRNVTVSTLRFAKIMEAVTEYNETNGRGYKKQWPQTGDLYYYVDTDGSVESCQYADKYDIDNDRKAVGNFFKTKEAAAIVAERVKAVFKNPDGVK